MRYTQSQLRTAVGLGPEVIRHWRGVMPPLRAKVGRSAHFTFGDLLALRLIRMLTESLGIAVGRIGPASTNLFEVCNTSPVHGLERCWLKFDGTSLALVSTERPVTSGPVAAVVMIKPVLDQLRDDLLDDEDAGSQRQLFFSPALVRR